MAGPSARILAAIELLVPRPGESLLEIGCGTGQALHAILKREPTVRLTAIDRSETAVARARALNLAAIKAGLATISAADIDHRPIDPGRFDRAFAICVNTFWTRPGRALPHVAASLKPAGELWMIYDAPAAKVTEPILASLHAYGATDIRTDLSPGAFAIVATMPA